MDRCIFRRPCKRRSPECNQQDRNGEKGVKAACAQGGRFRIVAPPVATRSCFCRLRSPSIRGRIDAEIVLDKPPAGLEHDWHLDKVRLKPGSGREGVELFLPDGRSTARWDGFVAPAALGAALRGMLGVPDPFAAASPR